ncbi:RHS repeat-associated core domain-containing protein [Pelagibius sp.]|uniref:golvesin C-terminal-like domain-containing protein n=1 Tax=Pelagibius sp. TaxID=1931238 RepID=UPI003B503D5D
MIEPKYDGQGNTYRYDCHIKFTNVLLYYQDLTTPSCPPGYEVNGNTGSGCQLSSPERLIGQSCSNGSNDALPSAGNPISVISGNKFQAVTDFETASAHSLTFTRYYNSQSKVTTSLGPGWRHSFDRRLFFIGNAQIVYHAKDGKILTFNKVGSEWLPASDVLFTLTQVGDHWELKDKRDRSETYDSSGRLLSITERDGYQQALEHFGPGSRLSLVHDSHGRRLSFAYNAQGMLVSVTDSEGRKTVYRYRKLFDYIAQPKTLLEEVTYPDGTPLDEDDNPRVQYLYEDPAFPVALTGLIDETGERYASWAYDNEGRAISSVHAGGVDAFDVAYNPDGSRTVTNPLGKQTTYHFTTINGGPKVSQVEGHASANCLAANADYAYDANGFLASTTDWEGNVTDYVHNDRGLLTSLTEAVGMPEERTTTTIWHNDFRLPTQIVAPRQTTDLTYDNDGLLTERTVTDTTSHVVPYSTNGQTRTWDFTYSDGGAAPGTPPPLPDVLLTLVNADAETGDTTGWTVTEGAFTVRSADPSPSQGSYYFYGGEAVPASRMHQDVAIPSGNWSEVDSDQRAIRLTWTQRSYNGNDQGAVVVRFLDAADQVIGSSYEYLRFRGAAWASRSLVLEAPPSTRAVQVELRAIRNGGTSNDAYFDELSLDLIARPPSKLNLSVLNWDAETGDLSGWTVESGNFEACACSPGPAQGDHFFWPGASNSGSLYQDLPVPGDQLAAVDSGDRWVDVSWWQGAAAGTHTGQAILEFVDASGYVIGAPVESTLLAPTTWMERRLTAMLPAGTRSVRVKLRGFRAYFDYVSASLGFADIPQLPLPRQLVSLDGPRGDVVDTVGFTYDAVGELETVTNALGHASSITARDGRGLPLTLLNENGIETELAYDPRGRLVSSRVKGAAGDAVTTFVYDAAGLMTSVTQPDGQQLLYEYDAAQRLTAITNAQGERIEYTLDAMGNVTGEVLRSDTGAIVRSQTRVFDELGRLLQQVGAATQTTTFGYDLNSNLTSITDPLNGPTTQAFDSLDRLVQMTDPLNGITGYGYDAQDNLVTVTDPRGLVTTYTYNGFGEVIQLESPDTGTTVFTLDPAGNVLSQTDARGVVTAFTYDALDRPLTRSYPAAPAEDVTYSYDDATLGNRGIGRLTGVTDRTGSTSLTYDDYGHLVEESRTIGGVAYVTSYDYDVAGNLLRIVYPDGRIVSYGRDALGRATSVLAQAGAAAAPVVVASDIVYEPFGPVSGLTFGNGVALDYLYDQDYRLTGIVAGDGVTSVQDLTLAYDNADNITAITDALDASRSQSFQYDDLYRLTQAIGLYGTIDYGYDAVGNRTSRTIDDMAGLLTETYTYDTASNRLLTLSDGVTTQGFGYSASGQITGDDRGLSDDLGFVYDDSDRLVQLQVAGFAETDYRHNAFGERVSKELLATNAITHFHYGQGGQLLGESDELGAFQRSYIYLDGLPIAQIEPLGGGGGAQSDQSLDNDSPDAIALGNWSAETTLPGHEGADYLVHPGADPVPAGGTVLDNASPDFSTTGLWPEASALPGFEGTNYQSRSASGPFAPTLEVDNLDPDVTVYGDWNTASRTLGGHSGPNYLWREENGLSPESVITDNVDPGFSVIGDWGFFSNSTGFTGSDVRWQWPQNATGDGEVIDNVDPGFSVIGDWGFFSNSTGFTGSDVRWQWPQDVTGDGEVVDNVSTAMTLTGPWGTSSDGSGYFGSDYHWQWPEAPETSTATWTPTIPASGQYHIYATWRSYFNVATNAPFTIHHAGGSTLVEVNQRTTSGGWNLIGTFQMDPGSDHRVVLTNNANGVVVADAVKFVNAADPPPAPTHVATWVPTITESGQYHVYGTWHAWSNHASNAPFTIHHTGGSTTVEVNQQATSGTWNFIGTFGFAPNSGHRVEVTTQADGLVVADALKFVSVDAPPPPPTHVATWAPQIPEAGQYHVYGTWHAWSNHATNAPFTIHHDGGSTTVEVNQQVTSGTWNFIGTFEFAPDSGHKIEVTTQADGLVVADAIAIEKIDAPPNSATWTLNVPEDEFYTLETRWISHANNASDAPFTVNHLLGSDTVFMNQQVGLGVWTSLGSYLIPGDGSSSVVLTDQANGNVVADAVRLTPDTSQVRTATWAYTPAESGDYRVFARWPEAPDHATDAKYSIQHTGGPTVVTVSQAQRGRQWNELGVFAMEAGLAYGITLSDDANGVVVADALYIVKTEPLTDAVTWAPVLPAAEAYQVYAKWTSDETRATDARYSIVHDGGTAEVTRNQRVGGGFWQYLGSYSFDPLLNPTVTLAANDNGSVAADAIRFVGGPAGTADIAFLHTDHLGTPQAMTDAGAQLLWWRDQTPFGQTVATGGFSQNPLRFTGQIADTESGLHYNYFRDYDPALGRYIQSDPIGLRGGLNTFGYVEGNPLRFIDPLGLKVLVCRRPADLPFPASYFDHYWIKTDRYESGMGGMRGGVPAQDGNFDKPYDPTQTVDHSGQAAADNASCEPMQNVSEECVNELIRPGRPTGAWHPYNQCRNFTAHVIGQCRYGPQLGPELPESTLQSHGPLGRSYRP